MEAKFPSHLITRSNSSMTASSVCISILLSSAGAYNELIYLGKRSDTQRSEDANASGFRDREFPSFVYKAVCLYFELHHSRTLVQLGNVLKSIIKAIVY